MARLMHHADTAPSAAPVAAVSTNGLALAVAGGHAAFVDAHAAAHASHDAHGGHGSPDYLRTLGLAPPLTLGLALPLTLGLTLPLPLPLPRPLPPTLNLSPNPNQVAMTGMGTLSTATASTWSI